ncbi:MAG: membrane integrity-associated transporter subunit PqiC [gamma proteobacterium symbiont of Taylorina sp.]|nr:membrane integrity-associated transporter subunit PqiC [gamma proteobacterium symbiont of Taylorina sp.]
MRKKIPFIILCCMTIYLAGCLPAVNHVPSYEYYTLSFQNGDNPLLLKNNKPAYGFVKVDLPHISSKHMTKAIIYSENSLQKNAYSQSEWKEPLPIMLQEWMVQSIEQTGLFEGVIRTASRANVPLLLETDIVKFEHVLYENMIHMALRVILIRYDKRKIIKQKLFSYKIPVEKVSASGAVRAFNRALIQFNSDLYQWLNIKYI